MFWLAFKTGLLTVLTLGIYRFWMKTRLRRWYWSATRPGGFPLEYVGTPWEKLLGFLFAVVILAFYIGVVNLILMFLSFSLFQGNTAAYLASVAGVVPLWFYAQYRARRYVLARSRWRGLRFGLEPGAWGYSWRALVHWALTIVSLGLLWPRMTFWLEKYRTDRTFYGTRRLHQGGHWTMLYASMKPLFLAATLGGAAALASWTGQTQIAAICGTLAVLLAIYGLVHYRVDSLKRLTATKTLDGASLRLDASPLRVLGIYVVGNVVASFAMLLPIVALAIVIGLTGGEALLSLDDPAETFQNLPRWLIVVLSATSYFSIFLLWSAFTHAFVTMPVWRHYARGLRIVEGDVLDGVRQRPRDDFEEAEGFAEALDVGASI